MRIGAEIGTGGEAVAMTVPYGLAGEPIVDALPTAVVAAFALLTRLADTAVLFGVAALYYWLADGRYDDDPRVTGATLFGIAALTLAAVTLAKAALALPRPPTAATPVAFDGLPGSLAAAVGDATVADGFGLPSGHAAGAVALYGGLARLLDRPVPRRRLAAAAVVIGLVAASRVVIGVHYVADVVAGLAVGLGCLVGGRRLRARRRRRAPRRRRPGVRLAGVGARRLAVRRGRRRPRVPLRLPAGGRVAGAVRARLPGDVPGVAARPRDPARAAGRLGDDPAVARPGALPRYSVATGRTRRLAAR